MLTALKTEDDDGSAQSVRYLALDGYQGGADTVGWSNLAFVPLLMRGSHPWEHLETAKGVFRRG